MSAPPGIFAAAEREFSEFLLQFEPPATYREYREKRFKLVEMWRHLDVAAVQAGVTNYQGLRRFFEKALWELDYYGEPLFEPIGAELGAAIEGCREKGRDVYQSGEISEVSIRLIQSDLGILARRIAELRVNDEKVDARLQRFRQRVAEIVEYSTPLWQGLTALTDFRNMVLKFPASAPINSQSLIEKLSKKVRSRSEPFAQFIDWEREASLEARSSDTGTLQRILLLNCCSRQGQKAAFTFAVDSEPSAKVISLRLVQPGFRIYETPPHTVIKENIYKCDQAESEAVAYAFGKMHRRRIASYAATMRKLSASRLPRRGVK